MRLCFCLLLLLLGCAPGHGLPPIPPGSREYRLGPGDTVRLIVFGEDQLTGEYRVGDFGSIAVPLIGGRARGRADASRVGASSGGGTDARTSCCAIRRWWRR